jgi:5-methylcytosine-specific restriction endonuclease McrBC GTP-binding regulatory subunit McrB
MTLSKDEVLSLARAAVQEMFAQNDPEFRFPPDLIWRYMPPGVVIPGPSKPHHAKRLVKEGYLELTGNKTKAQSEQRAGSTTNEYRFGPKLVTRAPAAPPPRPTAPAAIWASSAPTEAVSESLKKMQALMEAEGYIISLAELANFFLAMAVSPLVILSGISGTGKSLLPRKFAKRVGAKFHAIPVQPQWESNSDLFGYVPTLASAKYVKGALIDGLLEAKNNPGELVIALLDEMNLAPVEHYFSDFLSVAETRYREGSSIVTDTLPIELPPIDAASDEYAALRGIRLPSNLRVVGTANMDETTHTFSPKVLDRAFTIEFDDPDLTSFAAGGVAGPDVFEALGKFVIAQSNPISVQEARESSQDLFDHVAGLLAEIQDILSPAGIKFGYRTRDAILMYLHFWRECALGDIMAGSAALDFCILQKVLPKISGSGEGLESALKSLLSWLEKHGSASEEETSEEPSEVAGEFAGELARSAEKVSRMSKILELDGATRFWGA